MTGVSASKGENGELVIQFSFRFFPQQSGYTNQNNYDHACCLLILSSSGETKISYSSADELSRRDGLMPLQWPTGGLFGNEAGGTRLDLLPAFGAQLLKLLIQHLHL